MLGPVVMAVFRGREWCGQYCPRGSLWDQVFSKINPRHTIPAWAKTKGIRLVMLVVIFGVFGWNLVLAGPDLGAIGLIFLRIIFITTLVGGVLALVYSPRTWCSFCPMGTLASWLSEGKKPLRVSKACVQCNLCAQNCPMDLAPYIDGPEFAPADCIKCGQCVTICPKQALDFK
jgi:polyferredoxin